MMPDAENHASVKPDGDLWGPMPSWPQVQRARFWHWRHRRYLRFARWVFQRAYGWNPARCSPAELRQRADDRERQLWA